MRGVDFILFIPFSLLVYEVFTILRFIMRVKVMRRCFDFCGKTLVNLRVKLDTLRENLFFFGYI